MKKVTLKEAHEHKGVVRPSGTELEVRDQTAEWMEKHVKCSVAKVTENHSFHVSAKEASKGSKE